jgi:TRAP transporter TAXI family solute receptor
MNVRMRVRPLRRIAVGVAVLALLTAACGDDKKADSTGTGGGAAIPRGRISIATGGTGGVYFVYGGGLAKLISSNIEGVEATAEVTSASVDNLKLIGTGSSDVAFTLADTASAALNGQGKFTAPVKIRALARLYDNYTQVVVKADSSVQKVADLKGKRVSVGSPNSGTEVIALRMLEAAGLKPDADIKKQGLGINESVQALRDGTIDAFFWSGGLPTAGLVDLSSNTNIRLLPTVDLIDPLKSKHGEFYLKASIPAGTYKNDAPVDTVAVTNYLVVSEDMNEELAYQITKLMFDKKADLVQIHPEAKNLDPKMATGVEPLALHPGAERYFAGK